LLTDINNRKAKAISKLEDEIIASDRLKEILEEFDAVKAIGTYNKYQDALDHLLESQPGVILHIPLTPHIAP
jgi:DNA-binding NarL/FixJ family response regulator